MVELLFGTVLGLLGYFYGFEWTFWKLAIAVFAAVAGGLIDLETHRIPNKITYPTVVMELLISLVQWLSGGSQSEFFRSVLASVLMGGGLVVLALASKGIGLGDAKLVAAISPAVAAISLISLFYFLLLAFATGSVVGLGLIVAGKANRHSRIPFGPFLAIGLILLILASKWI